MMIDDFRLMIEDCRSVVIEGCEREALSMDTAGRRGEAKREARGRGRREEARHAINIKQMFWYVKG